MLRPRGLRDVRSEGLAREVEPADDELLAALESAVLVLDHDAAVVADGVERGEEAIPANLAEPRQPWHLPAHAERHHPMFVEAVPADLEVLRVHVEDPAAEVVDRSLVVDH